MTQIFHCCLTIRWRLFACLLLFRRNARADLHFERGLLLHRGIFSEIDVLITISRLMCVTVKYEIRGIKYLGWLTKATQ